MAENEVADYIGFRLQAAGAREHFFSAEACEKIAEASEGIPRVINILCDTSLVYGFSTGAEVITFKLISEVIEDKRNFGIFPANGHLVAS